MSAIAGLFALGVLAVGFPFLFHMIRRTPKGLTEFGSVMFLKPSPPILTRRSRLENILLLLLRAAAICLIASAFMRPFFRGTDTLSELDVANRRVVILLDTSASMRRTGLWEQAQREVENVLDALEDGDDVALLTFGDDIQSVVGFEDDSSIGLSHDSVSRIREAVNNLEPSWSRSDLGTALVSTADNLDVWRESQRSINQHSDAKLQIVVVSDLQKGTRLEALQAYQWPANVFVKFLTVEPTDFSNATVQLLDPIPEENDPSTRIRVANSEESERDQFFVEWNDRDGHSIPDPIPFYVPAGTSQVLKIPADQTFTVRQFVVSGDQEEFDNTFYVVPPRPLELEVVYLGNDEKSDPQGLLFYLERALEGGSLRMVAVRQLAEGGLIGEGLAGEEKEPTLVVVASPVDEVRKSEVDRFLNSGGTLLVVLTDDATTHSTSGWTGAEPVTDPTSRIKKSGDDYRMLADVRFSDPLFQPFANPRYNDFTQIRFWRHQPVEVQEEVNVLARFDNGDPAIWHRLPSTGGSVYTMASGWRPEDSQFALSTKFVPLMNGLVDIAASLPELNRSLWIDEPIVFGTADNGSGQRTIVKPDGIRIDLAAEASHYSGTDLPGIYRLVINQDIAPSIESADDQFHEFAVNVDRAESETAAIPIVQLEMTGVKIGEQQTAAAEISQLRDLRDREIEDRQKFWKWLIVAAMIFLICETWLAGRTASHAVGMPVSSSLPPEPKGELI